MKLSVLLVSVNLAATLPVAVATAASAADGASSDKADWLKSSLASMDTSVNQKKTARARKVSFSQPACASFDTRGPVPSNLVLHAGANRLRPFVPGRKLPSQHDLDVQFIAQQAKMAVDEAPNLTAMTPRMAPGPLAGQVSEGKIDSYGSVGYVQQSSSRVVPGQMPSAPGQIRQFRSEAKRTNYVSKPVRTLEEVDTANSGFNISMPPAMPTAPPLQPALQTPPPVMPSAPMMQEHISRSSPGLSPDEQAIIDRIKSEGMQTSSGGPGAGPAPFPLNLLPQDQLKQIIGGMRRPTASAPAQSFGSWRGNASALPTGGFQSYSGHGSFSTPRHSEVAHNSAYRAPHHARSDNHQIASLPTKRSQAPVSHSIAQVRRLTPHENVASLAPYARYGGASSIAF